MWIVLISPFIFYALFLKEHRWREEHKNQTLTARLRAMKPWQRILTITLSVIGAIANQTPSIFLLSGLGMFGWMFFYGDNESLAMVFSIPFFIIGLSFITFVWSSGFRTIQYLITAVIHRTLNGWQGCCASLIFVLISLLNFLSQIYLYLSATTPPTL